MSGPVRVAEAWVEAPLRHFVSEARVSFALLLHPSGQALGEHGFTRAVDVMSACALAAAIHATAGQLGRELEGKPMREMHYVGRDRQIFLAEVAVAGATLVFLTVFDRESSLGLVRLFFEELRRALAAAAPRTTESRSALAADFERELGRNLAAMFGRAPNPEPR